MSNANDESSPREHASFADAEIGLNLTINLFSTLLALVQNHPRLPITIDQDAARQILKGLEEARRQLTKEKL